MKILKKGKIITIGTQQGLVVEKKIKIIKFMGEIQKIKHNSHERTTSYKQKGALLLLLLLIMSYLLWQGSYFSTEF